MNLISRIFKFSLLCTLVVLGLMLLYLVSAFGLSRIPVVPDATIDTANLDIEIYLQSNGVHTELIVPTTTSHIDWRKFIAPNHTRSKIANAKYLAFGYGDRRFYLETPTWSDLKASVAFKAAFWLNNTAMHTTYYTQINQTENTRKIQISAKQYLQLRDFILNSFELDSSQIPIHIDTDAQYGQNDAFYCAKGRYSFLYTCNTWTNEALKASDLPAALWTPFDSGILYHYPKLNTN